MARSSPKKLPARDRNGRFVAKPKPQARDSNGRFAAKGGPKSPEQRRRKGQAGSPVAVFDVRRPGSGSVSKTQESQRRRAKASKPKWIAQLEKARLELRRAKRFTKTREYRELLKAEPSAKTAVKQAQAKLTRRIEKLRAKTGGPSPKARANKQERDRFYQQKRRQLSTHLAELFRHGVRVLGTDGADPYLDEYGVTEHVFWVEFRKRYA